MRQMELTVAALVRRVCHPLQETLAYYKIDLSNFLQLLCKSRICGSYCFRCSTQQKLTRHAQTFNNYGLLTHGYV